MLPHTQCQQQFDCDFQNKFAYVRLSFHLKYIYSMYVTWTGMFVCVFNITQCTLYTRMSNLMKWFMSYEHYGFLEDVLKYNLIDSIFVLLEIFRWNDSWKWAEILNFSVTKIWNRIKYKIDSSVMSTTLNIHSLTFRMNQTEHMSVVFTMHNI